MKTQDLPFSDASFSILKVLPPSETVVPRAQIHKPMGIFHIQTTALSFWRFTRGSETTQFGHSGKCLWFMAALLVIDKLLFKSMWFI